MYGLVTINTVVSTEFIKYERAARRFLLTTKDFIIDNYYAIMLTGTDDREIEKLTKHFIKSTNHTALHRQPLKMMSFKIYLEKKILSTTIIQTNKIILILPKTCIYQKRKSTINKSKSINGQFCQPLAYQPPEFQQCLETTFSCGVRLCNLYIH